MDLDLLQMLAEPGQRQLLVAGAGAVLGVAKAVWDMYKERKSDIVCARACGPGFESQDFYYGEPVKEGLVGKTAWALPAVIGIEEAIRNSSPAMGSYVIEASLDLSCTTVGYLLGQMFVDYLLYDKIVNSDE